MLHLPARFAAVILPFASLFAQDRTWRHAQMLLLGALLTPGQRTVCAILRMVGLRWERHFVSYHRVLNRAVWRRRIGTRLLFDMLLAAFAPRGPVVLGIDDTIERRRGKRIRCKKLGLTSRTVSDVVQTSTCRKGQDQTLTAWMPSSRRSAAVKPRSREAGRRRRRA